MERIAGEVESLHLGIADLDTLLGSALVEQTLDFEARVRRDGAEQLNPRAVKGRARQFWVICQNRRCSSVFHFEVPGG